MSEERKIIIVVLLSFFMINCRTNLQTELAPKFDFSYQDSWQYFKIEDTVNIEVISHLKAKAFCGTMAFASITIGKNEGDTIRVINLCNMEDYKPGDVVRFIPAEKPTFSVSLPYSTIYNSIEKKLDPGFYDRKIKKTTYGYEIK